jgi:hypothetical protein
MDRLGKAAEYVTSAGGPHHLLELGLVGIDAGRGKDDLVAEITALQSDDGSFAGTRDRGEPGSVPATASRTDILHRAGADEAAKKAAAWLAARQREDGGFCENAALASTLKPEWEWFSAEHTVTWITGEAMAALAVVGGFEPNVTRARNLLLRARNRDGGWPGQVAAGYPDRTDLWTINGVVQGLIAAGIAPNHDAFAGLAGALTRQQDRWRNPIENPLPAFLALGRRGADGDVQTCLKSFAGAQNKDGGWPYLAGGESHPDPTAAAVALLARYRLDLPA